MKRCLIPLLTILLLAGCGSDSTSGTGDVPPTENPSVTPAPVPTPTPPSDTNFSVALSAETLEGTAPLQVTLRAQATETATFAWYLDSAMLDLSGDTLSYTFDTPGQFLITVSATSSVGEVANDTLEVVITGGSGTPTPAPTPSPAPTPGSLTLSGTIIDWDETFGSTLFARSLLADNRSVSESFGSAPIDNSGAFQIDVGTPQRFAPFAPAFDCPDQETIVSTPSTLETAMLMLQGEGNGAYSSFAYQSFNSGGYGDTLALYVYATESGSISGQESCDPYSDDEFENKDVYVFDMTLQAGWNLIRFNQEYGNLDAGEGIRNLFTSVPLTYDLSDYRWVISPFTYP